MCPIERVKRNVVGDDISVGKVWPAVNERTCSIVHQTYGTEEIRGNSQNLNMLLQDARGIGAPM